MSPHGWLAGLKVQATIPGEESGWDEDRGRPEFVWPDTLAVGIVDRVGRTMDFGDAQIRICLGRNEDGEPITIWAWASQIEHVFTPNDDIPHSADMEAI